VFILNKEHQVYKYFLNKYIIIIYSCKIVVVHGTCVCSFFCVLVPVAVVVGGGHRSSLLNVSLSAQKFAIQCSSRLTQCSPRDDSLRGYLSQGKSRIRLFNL